MSIINIPWKIWYHSINDTNWDKSSYKELFLINNIHDFILIKDIFKQNHYQNGMFFIMKDNIFPNWEDPKNRMGGCLSFKVPSSNIIEQWDELSLRCLTENIMKDNNEYVNGISISPKKEFNIIKIWINEHSFKYNEKFNEIPGDFISLSNSIYKKHIVN